MRKDLTIAAEKRDSRGKNEARRLRAKGSMPAVIYGGPDGPAPVAVNPKELSKILNSKTGHNTIFNMTIAGGQSTPVMIVDWQFDPLKDTLLHADLKRVKIQGGIHEVVTREIEIECLPNDIPEQFTVNVSELMIGQSIRAGEIPMSESMKLISPADAVISHVVSLRAEETTVAETGTEAPAAAEPEVIKKGKKE